MPAEDLPLELEGEQYINAETGIQAGLPRLLARLGVADAHVEISDPADRDDQRMLAFEGVFTYFHHNAFMPPPNVKMLVRRLKVCVETERAADIIEEAYSRSGNCAAAANWLMERWDHPASHARKTPRRGPSP